MKRCIALCAMMVLPLMPVAAKSVSYYGDVRPIIEQKCLVCHSEAGVAFSFEDPEKAYDFRAAIALAVAARRMPPWMAEPGHQQYLNDYSLDDQQLALIARWAEDDYPKGKARRRQSAAAGPTAFKADMLLPLVGTKAYLPDQSRHDDYRCFVAQWPLSQPAFVTGIGAHPGNARISHHAIIYIAEPQYLDIYREFVEAEGGQGYQCFGGPLPDRLGIPEHRQALEAKHPEAVAGLAAGQFWLAHWAPGMEGYDLPPDTGIMVKPGSVVIVQMHYFTGFAPNESDAGTSLAFKTADTVRKPAVNWPLSRGEWLQARSNQSLVVPPQSRASVGTSASMIGLDQYIATTSDRDVGDFPSLEVHSANVHMHIIGAAGEVRLLRADQAPEVLLKIPRYEFGWQRDFFLAQPKQVARADLESTQLEVHCEFANPGKEPVYGGYSSEEEMCYNFSLLALSPDQPKKPAGSKKDAP
ncbi:MAG: hypothetical protein AB7E72_06770 [Lysobacterales bacterium]